MTKQQVYYRNGVAVPINNGPLPVARVPTVAPDWQTYEAAWQDWQARGGPASGPPPQAVRDMRRAQGEARDAELRAKVAPFRRRPKPLTMPASYDPTRYDPAKPIYDYDPTNYNPADYEAWKQSRIAYQLKKTGNTLNPFGPDGAASVRGKITAKGLIEVAWGNIVQIVRDFRRNRDGVVAIEAAIVLPVILVLMAVSFELGSMQLAKSAVVFATQQAAVVQSTGGNPQTSFAGNVASTPASNGIVTCNTTGNVATCTGRANFANAFAGILGSSPTMALSYTATVQVPAS